MRVGGSWKSRLGSIKANLWLLVASCVIGFVVLLVLGQIALRNLESSAMEMAQGKDIVADILPPPLYLIEPHLLAYQILDTAPPQRAAVAQKLQAMRLRYQQQNAHWLQQSQKLDASVTVALFGEQKTQGDAYWNFLEQQFLPLALAQKDTQARKAFVKLNSLYDAHRDGVDATVKVASAWANIGFDELSATKNKALWILRGVAGICVLAAVVLFWVVAGRIGSMLGAEPAELHHEMVRLARGDLAPSDKAAEQGSVFSALKMAQESLLAHVAKTEQTNRELHQTLEELNQLVGTDLLTGLWSRRRLEDALAGEMDRHRRYDQPLSLLVIDIDSFKSVNDRFGHQVGDKVLVQLASQIQLSLRASDMIARWGGEEFVVLCPNTILDTSATLAERLREEVAGVELPTVGTMTISVGVAQMQAEETWQEWFKRADVALYLAKNEGRNQVRVAQV
jgi:diguanylate cyclase (GGDEF)-like protein